MTELQATRDTVILLLLMFLGNYILLSYKCYKYVLMLDIFNVTEKKLPLPQIYTWQHKVFQPIMQINALYSSEMN